MHLHAEEFSLRINRQCYTRGKGEEETEFNADGAPAERSLSRNNLNSVLQVARVVW